MSKKIKRGKTKAGQGLANILFDQKPTEQLQEDFGNAPETFEDALIALGELDNTDKVFDTMIEASFNDLDDNVFEFPKEVPVAPEPKITPDILEAGKKIAEKTCVLEIHVRRPGFTKRIKSDLFLEKSGNNAEVSADILKVSQDIIDRKEISDLEKGRKGLIRYLKGLAIPGGMLTLGGGQYLIPLSRISEVRDQINDFEDKRNLLLNVFQENYDRIKEDAKVLRGDFYNELDYPSFSTIRGRYSLDYRFISNSVPEELKRVSEELYEAEKEKAQIVCANAVIEFRKELRENFLDLVNKVYEKIESENDNGEELTVSATRFNKLLNFVNTFDAIDFTEDKELKSAIIDAQVTLSGLDVDDINSNQELRKAVKESFKVIIDETEDLLEVKHRAMELD